jgi:hypothetical protein
MTSTNGKTHNPADKFTQLFDNKDWSKTKSGIRTQRFATYDPSYSWDGKMEDQEKFSRLKNTTMPFQQSGPVALLSGGVIHSLDNSLSFESLNIKHKPKQSTIPLTIEQMDVGMNSDLKGNVPVSDIETRQRNNGAVLADVQKFRNMDLMKPEFRSVERPSFLVEAGPQSDQRLLNPAQRREIMIFEKQRLLAEQSIKESKGFREKSRKQIGGSKFQRGILMVDSSENEQSEIYGEAAAQKRIDMEQKHQIHLERQKHLAHRSSATSVNGDFIRPETIPSGISMGSDFQSKGGNNHASTFNETYNRLFIRRLGEPIKATRTQNLRNNDLNGKQYNLVSHQLIEHWPSGQIDRLEDKKMHHASQASLENVRSLQGTTHSRQKYY